MTHTTTDAVHMEILRDAEDIANRRFAEEFSIDKESPWRIENESAFASGAVFRADPIQSDKGGLCLSVDELTVKGANYEQIQRIHQIGIESVREAIMRNSDSFVGLILGEARVGKNYFDRFGSEDQTRLF